jgi:hypothetical protein
MNKKQYLSLPQNEPLFAEYLFRQGFKRDQLSNYVKSGWFIRLHHGVYSRPDMLFTGLEAIKAAQNQLNSPLYIGGKSALALQGFSYFIEANPQYRVFYPHNFRINGYLKTFDDLVYKKNRLFTDSVEGFTKLPDGLAVASRERAILEMADEVTGEASYEEFYNVLELLTSLRPDLIQKLLESTHSIKVKRLFLAVSEKMEFQWFGDLDLSRVSLGSGPRQIEKNGVFNKKYNIVLPRLKNGI